MYERFTDRARKVMQLANNHAMRFNHEYVGTEHILLGVVEEGSGVGANVLKNLDVNLRKVRREVEKIIQTGSTATAMTGKLPQTPRARKAIEYAIDEARQLNHNYVGSEHLLLGLIREGDGVAAQVLMNLGLTLDGVRAEVMNLLGHGPLADAPAAGPNAKGRAETPTLAAHGRDLTDPVRWNDLAPDLGRAAEVECVLRAVGRWRRQPVLLLSDSVYLWSCTAAALARAATERPLAEAFGIARVVAVDAARFDRNSLGKTLHDLRREAKKVRALLVVENVHAAFRTEPAAVVCEAFLLRCRADGVPLVGATTDALYRRHVAPYAETFGGFRVVPLAAATVDESVAILTGLRDRYAAHHRVEIAEPAIRTAVELCRRGLGGRPLPDAALDVIDEAAAGTHLASMGRRPELGHLDAQIDRLNGEKETAVAEGDFETAAQRRDQADKLKREKDQIVDEWRERVQAAGGVVDEAAVRAVVASMTAASP